MPFPRNFNALGISKLFLALFAKLKVYISLAKYFGQEERPSLRKYGVDC